MINGLETYELLARLDLKGEGLRTLRLSDLAQILARVFRLHGYETAEVSPQHARLRPDIIVTWRTHRGSRMYEFIFCREGLEPVDLRDVQEVFGAINSVEIMGHIVSTGGFTAEARRFEKGKSIHLTDPTELRSWIRGALKIQTQYSRSFAERMAGVPSTANFGTLLFRPDENLPQPEILIPGLDLPAEYEQRLIQANHIPFEVLRVVFADPRTLHALTPREFEQFVAEILDKLKFKDVTLTPPSRDGGRDIIASKVVHDIPLTFFFECKKYAETNAVQLDTLRALLGVVAHSGSMANIGVLVTTSRFTEGCKSLIANECRLDGKDYEDIIGWISQIRHPTATRAG